MLRKIAAFAVLFFALSAPFAARAVSAKAYAVVDQVSGRLIEGQNTDQQLPMASTTKIMTALLACESGRLDETVTVPPDALRVEGSSMGLLPGERITLRDLVYGLLLASGNDAANTVAYTLGGSPDGFAALMNKKAAALGLSNTHFVTPSGLDAAGHYTTALDLARLGAAAMKNADFAKIAGTQKMQVTYNGSKNGRTLYNHNRLLRTYSGMTGIKTGHTDKSGRCLVTSATRDGVSLVVATLNDPDDWDDHTALLDACFSRLRTHTLLSGPLNLTEDVVGGLSDCVGLDCGGNVCAALTDSEAAAVTMEVQLPAFVYAPVQKGQKIGQLVFKVNGQVVATAPLTATQAAGLRRLRASKHGAWPDVIAVLLIGAGFAGFMLVRRRYARKETGPGPVRKLKEKETIGTKSGR